MPQQKKPPNSDLDIWIAKRDKVVREIYGHSTNESARYAANAYAEWILEELGAPRPTALPSNPA